MPKVPALDRRKWDKAIEAVKAEGDRADQRVHATATARVAASPVPREVPGWEPRKQSDDRDIEL